MMIWMGDDAIEIDKRGETDENFLWDSDNDGIEIRLILKVQPTENIEESFGILKKGARHRFITLWGQVKINYGRLVTRNH